MLSPWLELPGAADRLASWSAASGLDLSRLGTTASTEEITNTAIAQPLIVAATLLAYQELTARGLVADSDLSEVIVAGHSVGEIAAYAIAGVLAADDAVALAATRGSEMAKACAVGSLAHASAISAPRVAASATASSAEITPAIA